VQLYVGFICNVITFPINFLIAFLFKRSRPRRKRASRVQDALRRMREKQATAAVSVNDDVTTGRETPCTEDGRPMLDSVDPWGSQRYAEPMEAALPPTSTTHGDLSADTDPWSGVSADQHAQPPAKKKRLSLPWWCAVCPCRQSP